MKAEIYIKNISELPLVSGGKNDMRKKISCVTVNYEDAVTHFSTALYLDALITVLVLSGNATVYINYKAYSIRPIRCLSYPLPIFSIFRNVARTLNAYVYS